MKFSDFYTLSFYKPKLSDLYFHEASWFLEEEEGNNKLWVTDKRDACRIQLSHGTPLWPFDLRDIDGARFYYEKESQKLGGALVELSILNISGLQCLTGVFKYKSPIPNNLGMYYVCIIWIPLENCMYQINFESAEVGTTGMREATICAMNALAPKEVESKPEHEPETIHINSAEELFTTMKQGNAMTLPADDRKYDVIFPDHPLSKVRSYLDHFSKNLKVNKKLMKQKPYRVK